MKRHPYLLASLCILCSLLHHPASATDVAPRLKAPLAGLVQMGDIGFHRQDGGRASTGLGDLTRFPGIFGGTVINITWEQLEPTRGTLVTKELDRAVEEIRAYNSANPQRAIGARLRVWPGTNAPIWAKTLGGAPVAILHREMPITVGRFWAKPYRDAWRELQARLAARYDGEPLIREVTNTSGSSMTDESILLPGDSKSLKSLLAAGFADQQFHACLMDSPADFAGWRTTLVECICNTYRAMDSGKPKADIAMTLKLMQHWRHTLGARGVLSNHALSQPVEDDKHLATYEEMRRLGPPITFQTQSPGGLDWAGTLRTGLSYKAGSIELWSGTKFGGYETKSPQALQEWASWFRQ